MFRGSFSMMNHLRNWRRRSAKWWPVNGYSTPISCWRALDTDGTPLTARELEVLRLLASGAESIDIARSLSLSVGTIRNYLTSVVTKLDARNRVDAIRIASQAGWLP